MKLFTVCSAVLVSAAPALAQADLALQDYRDYLLGPGRQMLEKSCQSGKEENAKGVSFFDAQKQELVVKELVKRGTTESDARLTLRAQTAAMSKACPGVW